MSEEEADDERRLYSCALKYERIVKQFDELIEMMNNRARPSPKRRRLSSSCRGSSNYTVPASTTEAENDEAFVQSISKFLDNLQSRTDADCSNSTKNIEQSKSSTIN